MSQFRRHQGQAPRDSLLHPVWEPTIAGEPLDEAFVARTLLGAGWVAGKRKLSMLDLRVWAALCAMLREQLPERPSDLTLADADVRTVHTTGYQLAERVWADDGGWQYRTLTRSLVRLRLADVTVRVIERDPELAVETLHEGWVSLLGDMWFATTRLDLTRPEQWGALKGGTSLKIEIGRWPAQQVVAGNTTWLDLDLLRALGPGLSARVWACLEAWGRWPARSFDGCEETTIGLGEPARQSLGVGGYTKPADARRALSRAGARLVALDPAYASVRVEKRAGWVLVAQRVSGSRSRAALRKTAPWRSAGTAAGKRTRSERSAVRATVRQSLAGASDAQRPAVDASLL
jgi:hypothetical protein